MAVRVKNKTVDEILSYLQKQQDYEAQELYQQLLEDKVEQEREEMFVERTLPQKTKGGAWII